MKKENNQTGLAKVGTAIGVGLIAGLAGTVAITVSQMIEMKMTGRGSSDTPANAVREVFDVKPVSQSKAEKVSQEVHWTYGTSLGLIRSALSLAGLRGMIATAIHYVSIFGGKSIMLPALKVAKPVTEQEPKTVAIGALHHLVYAVTAGVVFDSIYCESKNKKGKKRKNIENNSEDKWAKYRSEEEE